MKWRRRRTQATPERPVPQEARPEPEPVAPPRPRRPMPEDMQHAASVVLRERVETSGTELLRLLGQFDQGSR